MGLYIRWSSCDIEPAGDYTFVSGHWNKNHEIGTGYIFILHKRIVSVLTRI
jgi:hypothetical protein